jgi:hypothetical protein
MLSLLLSSYRFVLCLTTRFITTLAGTADRDFISPPTDWSIMQHRPFQCNARLHEERRAGSPRRREGVYRGEDDYEVVVDFDVCGTDDPRGVGGATRTSIKIGAVKVRIEKLAALLTTDCDGNLVWPHVQLHPLIDHR